MNTKLKTTLNCRSRAKTTLNYRGGGQITTSRSGGRGRWENRFSYYYAVAFAGTKKRRPKTYMLWERTKDSQPTERIEAPSVPPAAGPKAPLGAPIRGGGPKGPQSSRFGWLAFVFFQDFLDLFIISSN